MKNGRSQHSPVLRSLSPVLAESGWSCNLRKRAGNSLPNNPHNRLDKQGIPQWNVLPDCLVYYKKEKVAQWERETITYKWNSSYNPNTTKCTRTHIKLMHFPSNFTSNHRSRPLSNFWLCRAEEPQDVGKPKNCQSVTHFRYMAMAVCAASQ